MAHRDFDAERIARWQEGLVSFDIGGDHYTIRPVVDPGVVALWDEVGPDTPNDQAFSMLDQIIEGFILPGQAERWKTARGRRLDDMIGPDASEEEIIEASRQIIDLPALFDVIPWMVEQVTGRPFEQPNDSSGMPAPNGTGSTGDSPQSESTPASSTSGVS